MTRFQLVALVLLALCLPGLAAAERPAGSSPAAPKDAVSLFSKLATVQGFEARFREEKKLALLRAPVVSEGRLYYLSPGYLLRKVERPSASQVRITPKHLVVSDSGGERQIDLRSRPSVKLFVESFTRVLAGDRQALESIYNIKFVPGSDSSWTLELLPKRAPLTQLIRSVSMSGRGFAVETVRVMEANGDFSETRLFEVDPERRFSDQDRQTLFGIEAKEP